MGLLWRNNSNIVLGRYGLLWRHKSKIVHGRYAITMTLQVQHCSLPECRNEITLTWSPTLFLAGMRSLRPNKSNIVWQVWDYSDVKSQTLFSAGMRSLWRNKSNIVLIRYVIHRLCLGCATQKNIIIELLGIKIII